MLFRSNNPDKPEKWFSLRYELFRIKPDASGDEAWRRELKKYWVDDIRSIAISRATASRCRARTRRS